MQIRCALLGLYPAKDAAPCTQHGLGRRPAQEGRPRYAVRQIATRCQWTFRRDALRASLQLEEVLAIWRHQPAREWGIESVRYVSRSENGQTGGNDTEDGCWQACIIEVLYQKIGPNEAHYISMIPLIRETIRQAVN